MRIHLLCIHKRISCVYTRDLLCMHNTLVHALGQGPKKGARPVPGPGPTRDSFVYTQLCETIRNYAKLYKTMRNYAKLCETMRNYTKLRETIRNYAKLYKTMRNYVKLYETIRNHAKLCKTIRN